MGKRPKIFAPNSFDLKHNAKTELYETVEAGITYQLTYSQMNDMKIFFAGCGYKATMAAWFGSLEIYERKKVKRLGVPAEPDDFFPDNQWED